MTAFDEIVNIDAYSDIAVVQAGVRLRGWRARWPNTASNSPEVTT